MIWGQLGRSDCRNCVERGAIVSVSHGQIWLLVRANSLGELLVREMLGNSGIWFPPGWDLGACGMMLAMRICDCYRLLSCPRMTLKLVIFSLEILGFELLICQDNRADRGESGHKRLLLLQN